MSAAHTSESLREQIRDAKRVVVKVGSSSITYTSGGINHSALTELVGILAERRHAGKEVLLVSSGAISAGMAPLGMQTRPTALPEAQAAAAVGQGQIMSAYSLLFQGLGLTAGQVLLTSDDVTRRTTYLNGRSTLETLLDHGAVPIINENDTVATQEIRFGDNDRLAALVSHLIDADALILLSDVDSLYDGPPSREGTKRIPFVPNVEEMKDVEIGGTGSGVGTGGMRTKIDAARIATAAGVPTMLTSMPQAREAFAGDDIGTAFAPTGRRRGARRLWLAHATTPAGRLVLDEGAVKAVRDRGRSLLHAGVVATEGRFLAGDAVDLADENGTVFARGLVNYDVADVERAKGRSTRELSDNIGPAFERSLVHRDHLVVLP
ncbi:MULTISPECIES: glutamate 5-kinase [Dermacoccus]|uniref:Glutamate 5-kinase n=1 Tax=Dermacoccus profundi TaxID=322602 RepID=A0ABP4NNT7_9MICO|nr:MULTISPECIES: glutamate 5-kinase [Dermacoccus]MBE7371114.1 glutamate 5-kinase [Dermacoccus barathri]MBZ4497499.1 glutamate 5-kinase [Dermacoccus sp. Tok2021]MCT1986395.1 glutamate 5-kinase [Dermacoccus abyssi]